MKKYLILGALALFTGCITVKCPCPTPDKTAFYPKVWDIPDNFVIPSFSDTIQSFIYPDSLFVIGTDSSYYIPKPSNLLNVYL